MNIFLPKTSFPCYLTSHDEDQTPGVSDDGGENRGKRREGAGGGTEFHCKPLKRFDPEKQMKGNERKLGLFSQHPRAPFRVCVRSCTFRKGRAAGGRRPNNCTDSFLMAKRECRRKTPLNLLGLGRLGSFQLTNFVEDIAGSRSVQDYRSKQSYAETVTRRQSLSYGPNYNAAYCLAVCPAGGRCDRPLP